MNKFYSNGKLLLTGEYAVLDGALSLALPTKYGQSLTITKTDNSVLSWKSLDEKGNIWFVGEFDIKHTPEKQSLFASSRIDSNQEEIANTLLKILLEAKKLNPEFLKGGCGFEVVTKLTFPRDWGLGSSSTLINNIAQWAKVDAFKLLWNAFSGSGYDIACAQNNSPISYKVKNMNPEVTQVNFNPSFKDQLYFVYLNKKQNSREGINHYKLIKKSKSKFLNEISEITKQVISCNSLKEFERYINLHEELVSKIIDVPKVKDILFPNYFGSIKSLGAWGGDFILVSGNEKTPIYFKEKGFETVLNYSDIML